MRVLAQVPSFLLLIMFTFYAMLQRTYCLLPSIKIGGRPAFKQILRAATSTAEAVSQIGHSSGKEPAALDVSEEEDQTPWMFRPSRGYQPSPMGGGYMEQIELEIETLTNTGSGLGRYGPDGWVIMVPHTIPGEKVKVGVHRNFDSYSEATLLEVLEPSPSRISPKCKYFGICGGCQYQHMDLETQRHWKTKQVEEALRRLGGLADAAQAVNPAFGTAEAFGYRSKLTPHYDVPRQGEESAIGFKRMTMPTIYELEQRGIDLSTVDRREILDVARCEIATDAINARLGSLRAETRALVAGQLSGEIEVPKKKGKRKHSRPMGATLLLRDALDGVETDQTKDVYEEVRGVGLRFEFKAGEFFQNNPFVLPHMVEYVLNKAKAPGVTKLLDTYCGGGLFCLSASPHFEECAGVEISEASIASAKRNAALNKLDNCNFIAGRSENIFGNVTFNPEETAIIIDPPRKGCDQKFLDQLFAFSPARVVYVSCDPATQARDTKIMVEAGYAVTDIQPFDLFPQTRHIENVITFDGPRVVRERELRVRRQQPKGEEEGGGGGGAAAGSSSGVGGGGSEEGGKLGKGILSFSQIHAKK